MIAIATTLPACAEDRLRDLQQEAVQTKDKKAARAYHFGSQGPKREVFSNHGSHTNRMVPVYVFGRKADLGSVTGSNSRYRTAEGVKPLFGVVPGNTVNPEAEYADQSDLYKVQKDAVDRGAKYVFTVWFDGLDWDTTRAAAIVKAGKVTYSEGKGTGLAFQDFDAGGSAQYGFVVTSPTHDRNVPNVDDADGHFIPATSMGGGYDPMIAGPTPWTPGPLFGKRAGLPPRDSRRTRADKAGAVDVPPGGSCTPIRDSSQSAGEYATGMKAYNNGVNVTDDNRFVPTLFGALQASGWKVGTVTSVAFDHVSPAAMYAHNVHRDDYQDLAREMLGLPSITQQDGKEGPHEGLDVVMGCGYGQIAKPAELEHEGKNVVPPNLYFADSDLAAIDATTGGKYVVVRTELGTDGSASVKAAAAKAAADGVGSSAISARRRSITSPTARPTVIYRPVPGIGGRAGVVHERRRQGEPDPHRHDRGRG